MKKGVAQKKIELEISLVGIHGKEGDLRFARSERKIPVLRRRYQRFSRFRAACVASTPAGLRGGGPSGHVVRIKRAADGRRLRSRKIIDGKREKCMAKNGFLWNTSTDSKGAIFVTLKNYASVPIGKERLSPTSQARRETS